MVGLLDVILAPIILTIQFLRDKFREWKEKRRRKKELKAKLEAAVVSSIDRATNRVSLTDWEGGIFTVEGAGIADEIHDDMLIIIGDESFGEERPDISSNRRIQTRFDYGSASGQAFRSQTGRSVVFENAYFPGDGWTFSDYDNITFKYCLFHSKSPTYITEFAVSKDPKRPPFRPWDSWQRCLSFANVNRIQFEQCCFYNCNGIAVAEKNVQSASFEKCHFENCLLLHTGRLHHDWPPPPDWTPLGALIHNDGTNGTNTISHSEFVNCGGICTRYYHVSAFLSDCVCILRGNQFRNCHHYRNTSGIHPKKTGNENHKKVTLFLPNTVNEGNTLINSAKIS